MTDFSKLLAKASSNADKFKQAIEKESQTGFQKDETFWTPTVDKATGNGYAVIRFLPPSPHDGEDALPWVKYFSHGFKGPTGQWYIENSLTTLGQPDPVSEYNSKLWSTGTPDNKKLVSERKRKLSYVSNIQVITDPSVPDNNGKVFKYRYGKKIFEKIEEAMNPEKFDASAKLEGKEGFDPFHMIEGANFKLKIRKVEGYPNYDKSEFDTPAPLAGGDVQKLEEIWRSEYSLNEVIAPNKFKDYGTLKNRLELVLGLSRTSDENAPAPGAAIAPVTAHTAETISLGDEDDPDLFENLSRTN